VHKPPIIRFPSGLASPIHYRYHCLLAHLETHSDTLGHPPYLGGICATPSDRHINEYVSLGCCVIAAEGLDGGLWMTCLVRAGLSRSLGARAPNIGAGIGLITPCQSRAPSGDDDQRQAKQGADRRDRREVMDGAQNTAWDRNCHQYKHGKRMGPGWIKRARA
jgi:hypothetical protein